MPTAASSFASITKLVTSTFVDSALPTGTTCQRSRLSRDHSFVDCVLLHVICSDPRTSVGHVASLCSSSSAPTLVNAPRRLVKSTPPRLQPFPCPTSTSTFSSLPTTTLLFLGVHRASLSEAAVGGYATATIGAGRLPLRPLAAAYRAGFAEASKVIPCTSAETRCPMAELPAVESRACRASHLRVSRTTQLHCARGVQCTVHGKLTTLELHVFSEFNLMSPPMFSGSSLIWRATTRDHSVKWDTVRCVAWNPNGHISLSRLPSHCSNWLPTTPLGLRPLQVRRLHDLLGEMSSAPPRSLASSLRLGPTTRPV